MLEFKKPSLDDVEKIKDILKNEHCSNKEYSLFKNELALNLDNVEKNIINGEENNGNIQDKWNNNTRE